MWDASAPGSRSWGFGAVTGSCAMKWHLVQLCDNNVQRGRREDTVPVQASPQSRWDTSQPGDLVGRFSNSRVFSTSSEDPWGCSQRSWSPDTREKQKSIPVPGEETSHVPKGHILHCLLEKGKYTHDKWVWWSFRWISVSFFDDLREPSFGTSPPGSGLIMEVHRHHSNSVSSLVQPGTRKDQKKAHCWWQHWWGVRRIFLLWKVYPTNDTKWTWYHFRFCSWIHRVSKEEGFLVFHFTLPLFASEYLFVFSFLCDLFSISLQTSPCGNKNQMTRKHLLLLSQLSSRYQLFERKAYALKKNPLLAADSPLFLKMFIYFF